ncbi:hypothetical protein F383_10984 [Gossypium arboreum]|uniref:Uncharacterized protein n=1 Tax=Gossypium arboreum TaxID=29729 RepID=A0A0B0Q375_GOSAR|nr:hypothetical protein F383_10984 [Gossypium arboreum]
MFDYFRPCLSLLEWHGRASILPV